MSHTPYQIDPQKEASRKDPMKMICKMAGAVLDEDTGYLFEYCHLIKHPHHKEVWGSAFGKGVVSLSQGITGIVEGTDTLG